MLCVLGTTLYNKSVIKLITSHLKTACFKLETSYANTGIKISIPSKFDIHKVTETEPSHAFFKYNVHVFILLSQK